jgi:hypothetical protein
MGRDQPAAKTPKDAMYAHRYLPCSRRVVPGFARFDFPLGAVAGKKDFVEEGEKPHQITNAILQRLGL